MKKYHFLIALLYFKCMLFGFEYFTYPKIDSTLHAWQAQFGTTPHPSNSYSGFGIIYSLDTIGYSSQDALPIYAVKLSANVNIREAEPKVLILGQCHAEEIYGVEISMEIIKQFLYPDPSKKQFLQEGLFGSEIWIIPTYNPEGLNVVHGWDRNGEYLQDFTYRKNIRDVINYNSFDYKVGIGNDQDGVDLNRNYDFNWSFGDTLLQGCSGSGCTTYPDDYDYYKGEYPESESEVRAIVDLAMDQKFLLSIAYHSSRSGRIDRYIIYPWAWKDKCKCDVTELKQHAPGFNLIESMGTDLASIVTSYQNQDYQHTGSSYRKGNAQDWFYSETGCIQYLIEAGHSDTDDNIYGQGLLVEENYIDDVVESNLDGFFHLLMRAVGSNYNSVDANQIRGTVMDTDGSPISGAIISISKLESDLTKPRLTDKMGFYARLLYPDETYDMSVSAFGYETITIPNIDHSSAKATTHDFILPALPKHVLKLNITTPDNATSSFTLIRKHFIQSDTLIVAKDETLVWPEGNYEISVNSSSYMMDVRKINLTADVDIDFDLLYQDIIFQEHYESNSFGTWNSKLNGNEILLPLDFLNEEDDLIVEIFFKYELEHGYDHIIVNYLNDSDTTEIKRFTGNSFGYHSEYIPISATENQIGSNLYLKIDKDDSIEYPGVEIDYIKIMRGSKSPLALDSLDLNLPYKYDLSQNFPNPFNPSTSISFTIPRTSKINLSIYDIRGVLIEHIVNDIYELGTHTIDFDSEGYSSGIYLYRLKSEGLIFTKKFMIIK